MEHYWYIRKWDGTEIRVKPKAETIGFIKQRLSQGGGHLITTNATIAVSDVKEFYESDEVVATREHLLGSGNVEEDIARAFVEPIFTEDGAVVIRPVKRTVPRRKWDSFYSKIPAYIELEDRESQIIMGFWLPTHLIDLHKQQYCTEEEAERMKR